MNNQFDELTKSLAQSVTRRAALKKFGVGLADMALGTVWFVTFAVAGPPMPPAQTSSLIPWSAIGAKAGVDYRGDGLTVSAADTGARLHCAFQRLDGEATREGLWLTSTVPDQPHDRFRVTAAILGNSPLARSGTVTVTDKMVRFNRPGLVEEYTMSVDGVRQDFVVLERPAPSSRPSPLVEEVVADLFAEAVAKVGSPSRGKPAGDDPLRVELAVTGVRVQPLAGGAQLVLQKSGRKLTYSRLKATDANGKELPARMEVTGGFEIRNPNSEMGLAVVVDDTDAVYPIRIDPTFSDANWISMNPSIPGADSTVSAAVADASGNLYIGGSFTMVGDILASRIAKWDGSSWSALGSGMNNEVFALALLGNDLYAGGNFTTAGGVPANRIAKWDGSSWSALGGGLDNGVLALALAGNDLYAGGTFTLAGGTNANSIAKWNGSSWSALGLGTDLSVYALAVSGGDVYAAGGFTAAGGSAAHHIAKWNGSNWSALGTGMGGGELPYESALAVSGSELYAGGDFRTAGGKISAYVARAALGDAPGYNRLTGALISGGEMQYSYVGYPATNYALDRTFNLASPINWIGQQTNNMTVSGVLLFSNTPAPATNNFWRVRSVP